MTELALVISGLSLIVSAVALFRSWRIGGKQVEISAALKDIESERRAEEIATARSATIRLRLENREEVGPIPGHLDEEERRGYMYQDFGGRVIHVTNDGPHDAIDVRLELRAPLEEADYLFIPDAIGSHLGTLAEGEHKEIWLNRHAIGLLQYELTWVDGHGENTRDGVVPGSDIGYLA